MNLSECGHVHLWTAIGKALFCGLWCCFIDAGPNTVVSPGAWSCLWSKHGGIRKHTAFDASMFLYDTLRPFSASNRFNLQTLGVSSYSCTIYPTVIETLSVPIHQSVTFRLVEGQIIFGGRYQDAITAIGNARPKTSRSLPLDRGGPSHIGGQDKDPVITIRDGYNSLEILCTLHNSGISVAIDLEKVILGYIGMQWASTCFHPASTPFDRTKHKALGTSLTSPAANDQLGIALTRWNPMAQFLCCEDGYQAVLQRSCCLNCTIEELGAVSETSIVIICG